MPSHRFALAPHIFDLCHILIKTLHGLRHLASAYLCSATAQSFAVLAQVLLHAGYQGVPSFKIRPKSMSMHGRQLCQDPRSGKTVFSVAKISRIKTMSLRHNLEVCIGDSSDEVCALRNCFSSARVRTRMHVFAAFLEHQHCTFACISLLPFRVAGSCMQRVQALCFFTETPWHAKTHSRTVPVR